MDGFKKLMIPLGAAAVVLSGIMFFHSLNGTSLIGCGAGSGCESVTGSRWAYVFGRIPVSLPALFLYVILLLCTLFLGGKGSESLDRQIRSMLPLFAGCIVGSAIWFSWLQLGVLHAFCKYCTLLHLVGCVIASVILCYCRHLRLPMFLAGLVVAGIFAIVQYKTLPSALYDSGRTDSELPVFSEEDVFCIGPEDAGTTLTLLFDYQCGHCRKLHKLLPSVCRNESIRVLLCPVPLSSDCNPYIPDGIDRFAGSCRITRIALAMWYSCQDKYPEFESYLMDGERCPSPAEVETEAVRLLGNESFDAAIQDARIDKYLSRIYELFGRTSTAGKGAVPRFISGQKWVVIEADTTEDLTALISSTF